MKERQFHWVYWQNTGCWKWLDGLKYLKNRKAVLKYHSGQSFSLASHLALTFISMMVCSALVLLGSWCSWFLLCSSFEKTHDFLCHQLSINRSNAKLYAFYANDLWQKQHHAFINFKMMIHLWPTLILSLLPSHDDSREMLQLIANKNLDKFVL